jgi:uncharacterized protein YceK
MKKLYLVLAVVGVFAACGSLDRSTASEEEHSFPKIGEQRLVN